MDQHKRSHKKWSEPQFLPNANVLFFKKWTKKPAEKTITEKR